MSQTNKTLLEDSDEEQFEVGADGKIRLKGGKKKINLDKLTDEDLRRLGIDPNLSKAEIARRLKVFCKILFSNYHAHYYY